MNYNELPFLTRFSNSDFAEWVIGNRKLSSSFTCEVQTEGGEPTTLVVLIPDEDGDGYLEKYEEAFQYEDINDLIEDLFVANEKWTCERY